MCWACGDVNFNVLGLIDGDGNLVERYEYTPYGQRTVYAPAGADDTLCMAPRLHSRRVVVGGLELFCDLCPFGHQGLYHDREFGLVHNRRRTLNPVTGRFMQRDPAGYVDGMGLYEYTGSRPTVGRDAQGLWRVLRTGEPRAIAIAEELDSPETLAITVSLNASEFKKWMRLSSGPVLTTRGKKGLSALDRDSWICPGEMVTVPNTAYTDADSYDWGVLAWYLVMYRNGLIDRYTSEGLYVVHTGIWGTTKASVLSHLRSRNLYRYAFIGHGMKGTLILNDGGKETLITPDKYTAYGIAEMQLVACDSNVRVDTWKRNVAEDGWLRTVIGALKAYRMEFADDSGAPEP